MESFDVPAMIQDVVTTIQPLVAKNGNQLVVQSAADLGTMHADLTRLRQCLFNLLSNACKFTEQGTISLEVARAAQNGADWVAFTVRDSGIGMTKEQLERIFQAFSRRFHQAISRNACSPAVQGS